MKQKTTPMATPWIIRRGQIWSDPVGEIISIVYRTEGWTEGQPIENEDQANAALIVRAVNCHDDLVAALQAARKFAISAIGAMVTGVDFDPAEHVVVRKIDAALARAREMP